MTQTFGDVECLLRVHVFGGDGKILKNLFGINELIEMKENRRKSWEGYKPLRLVEDMRLH